MRTVTWLAVATALLVLASVVPDRVSAVASTVPGNIRLTWSDDPKTTQTVGRVLLQVPPGDEYRHGGTMERLTAHRKVS